MKIDAGGGDPSPAEKATASLKCYTDHDRPPQDPPFPVCLRKYLGDYCDGEGDSLYTDFCECSAATDFC